MWKHVLGANHPDVAMALNNLADLYIELGKYEQAEPLCEQALQIRTGARAEHPEVAYALRHLADLYMEQGKYEQAEPLYRAGVAHLGTGIGAGASPGGPSSQQSGGSLYRAG